MKKKHEKIHIFPHAVQVLLFSKKHIEGRLQRNADSGFCQWVPPIAPVPPALRRTLQRWTVRLLLRSRLDGDAVSSRRHRCPNL